MEDAIHQTAKQYEMWLLAGSFIIVAAAVIIALGYEIQTKRRMP